MHTADRHSYSLPPQLAWGFAAAVLVHVALFATFPSFSTTKVIEAAMQSGATMLHISIAKPQETKPVSQPPMAYKALMTTPKANKKHTKPLPQKQPQNAKPVLQKIAPPPKATATAETAPSPIQSANPKPIPITTQVSLRGKRIAPTYPKRALRMKQEGVVMLNVLVDKQGGQKEIKLARSSQFPLLDRAALDAVSKWRFNPTTKDNEAILSWVQVPVEFRIR